MKPVLRIDFCDFGPRFDKFDNFVTKILSTRFDVHITLNPDIVIYADSGNQHRLHTCRRVFLTGEEIPHDFPTCDYALTPLHEVNDKCLRIPYYVRECDPALLVKDAAQVERIAAEKTAFCAFVVSYAHRKTRNRVEFFHKLSRYKKVNSAGRLLNNIGGPLPSGREAKIAFLRRHKFVIAFENAGTPGFTTEKPCDAIEAGCIPIYWGAPDIAKDFNPKSLINVADFPSFDHAVAHVVRVDNDPQLYRAMLAEPFLHGNKPGGLFDPARYCDFFEKILADTSVPSGQRGIRAFFKNWNRWVLVKRNKF